MNKVERNDFRTGLGIAELRQILRTVVGKATISPVQYDMLDEPVDFAVVVEKSSFFGGDSVVQVHINDVGDHRQLSVVAIGDSGFARAMAGLRYSASLSASRKYAASIIEAIRRSDPSLQPAG